MQNGRASFPQICGSKNQQLLGLKWVGKGLLESKWSAHAGRRERIIPSDALQPASQTLSPGPILRHVIDFWEKRASPWPLLRLRFSGRVFQDRLSRRAFLTVATLAKE